VDSEGVRVMVGVMDGIVGVVVWRGREAAVVAGICGEESRRRLGDWLGDGAGDGAGAEAIAAGVQEEDEGLCFGMHRNGGSLCWSWERTTSSSSSGGRARRAGVFEER